MLKNIELFRFKAFKENKSIQIKPLTILCGVNSGGKSSILKSLLLMKQSYESNNTSNEAVLNGLYTVNGSMKEVIHNGIGNTFAITNSFEIVNSGQRYDRNSQQDIISAKELKKIFNVYSEGFFKIENRIKFNIGHQENLLSTNYIQEYSISICDTRKGCESNENKQCKVSLLYRGGGKYDIDLENFPTIDDNKITVTLKNCVCYFGGMKLNNLFCTNPPAGIKLQEFLNNLYSIFRIVGNQYDSIKYLGPLRDYPERQYVINRNNVGVSVSGSDLPFTIAKNEKKMIYKNLFPPCEENDFKKMQEENSDLTDCINSWMQYFDLGKLEIINEKGVLTLEIGGKNISDVGFGVSQVLPVILEAITMKNEQTLVLEQPEIHLHPKMQMRMADLLIKIAMNNRNIIVETHSDHIINRIIRRALECDDLSILNNIAIYFVENSKDGSNLNEIIIDRVQGIAECPDEFFRQFAAETNMIFRAGFDNLHKGEK